MNANTFLVDNEWEAVCNEYNEKMELAEKELQEYITQLNDMIAQKTIEGKQLIQLVTLPML